MYEGWKVYVGQDAMRQGASPIKPYHGDKG